MAAATTSRRSGDRPRPRPQPFSVDHFRLYGRKLVLDNGDPWEPEDWQLAVVEDLFAGTQQVWLIVPQGNGKTTLMGAIALYHTDFTYEPWVPIAAATAKQARILYDRAEGFIRRTPELGKRFKPQGGYMRILSRANGGWGINVYAADKDTGQGVIPTLFIIDEGHAQKDLGVYRTWRGKLKKRGGQGVMISTAGEPGSDFEETRDAIRNGATEREQITPAYARCVARNIVMHEYRVPSPDKARDLVLVKAANPLSTITTDDLEELLNDPTLDWGEDWLRQTCNIPARSSQSAIADADWDHAFTRELVPEGVPVWLGADFAWSHDTTALVPYWIKATDCRIVGTPEILKPPGDGTMLDPQEVKDAFERIHARNPVERVVADKTKAQDTLLWMENEHGVEIIDWTQGPKNEVLEYESFMEALRGGGSADDSERREPWMRHTGDRALRRHVMNAIARRVPGDKRVFDRPAASRNTDQAKKDRRVIDALKALAMVNAHYAQVGDSAPMFAMV